MMAAGDERKVEYVRKLHTIADEHREASYTNRWRSLDRMYRNRNKPRRLRGQDDTFAIPDPFRVIETLTPHHVLGMFRNDRWFSVESPGAPSDTYPLLCRSLLLHGWRRMNGYVKTMHAVKNGNIRGHAVGKLFWLTEIAERQVQDIRVERDSEGGLIPRRRRITVPDVRHNGPQLEVLDLFNVWLDPTGAKQFYIQAIPSTLTELRETNKRFDGALYRNLENLKERVTTDPIFRRYAGNEHKYNELAETTDGVPQPARDADHVDLWQFWGYVNPSVHRYSDVLDEGGGVVEKGTQWRLLVIADGEVLIRDEPAPTPDHRPPFIEVPAIPIEGQIYGDSVLSYIEGLCAARNQLENDRLHEIRMQMFGTHAIHSGANVDARMFKEPGGYIKVTPPFGLGVNDVFTNVPRSPILPEGYAESAVKERQMLDISGATEPFQGTFAAGGSHRTKAEFDGTVNLGSARIQQSVWWWDEMWKKEILERSFRLYQLRLTTPEIIQLAGQPEVFGEIDVSDLEYDINVWVDSGMFGSMDSAQFDRIIQSIQVIGSVPEWAINIDPRKLVDRITYRSGIAGMDDILRSRDEVAQLIAAQAEQEAILAALQGSQAGAGRAQ